MTDAVGVVVVAAGSGSRLGSDRPKALIELAGRPLVVHAVDSLLGAGLAPPVIVHPDGYREAFAEVLAGREVAALVAGGATRTDSVRAGLAALDGPGATVLVHDAARPLTPPEVVDAVVRAVLEQDDVVGAAPGIAIADTIKRLAHGRVVGTTVDREHLVAVQTPQVVDRRALAEALDGAVGASDELGLLERLIEAGGLVGRVVVVPGSPWGLKITHGEDLAVAEALAAAIPAVHRGGSPSGGLRR